MAMNGALTSLRDAVLRPDGSAPTRTSFRTLWWRGAFVVAGIAATWFVFSSLMTPPWWAQSGLPADPGNFVARLPVDYPFCADWSVSENGVMHDQMMADLKRPGVQVTTATTADAVPAGGRTNLGLLLPRSAKILKVYCASAADQSAMLECSGARCSPPMSTLVEDNDHRRGRALIVTFLNPLASAPPVRGHLWVIWQKPQKS